MPEIDTEGLQQNKQDASGQVEKTEEPKPWEREDAPRGSTHASLMVYERGKPVRVHGPTHYHHLADGRVAAHYGGGTHRTEPGPDGTDRVTRIIAIHEG